MLLKTPACLRHLLAESPHSYLHQFRVMAAERRCGHPGVTADHTPGAAAVCLPHQEDRRELGSQAVSQRAVASTLWFPFWERTGFIELQGEIYILVLLLQR